jgi:hypothetical protein
MATSYDQNLRNAMYEIEDILKKYDCGGFVSLHSQSHGEFKLAIDSPTWSMISKLRSGDAAHLKLHMKSKPLETEGTVGMIASLRDTALMLFKTSDELMTRIQQVVEVDHTPIFGRISNDDRDKP